MDRSPCRNGKGLFVYYFPAAVGALPAARHDMKGKAFLDVTKNRRAASGAKRGLAKSIGRTEG